MSDQSDKRAPGGPRLRFVPDAEAGCWQADTGPCGPAGVATVALPGGVQVVLETTDPARVLAIDIWPIGSETSPVLEALLGPESASLAVAPSEESTVVELAAEPLTELAPSLWRCALLADAAAHMEPPTPALVFALAQAELLAVTADLPAALAPETCPEADEVDRLLGSSDFEPAAAATERGWVSMRDLLERLTGLDGRFGRFKTLLEDETRAVSKELDELDEALVRRGGEPVVPVRRETAVGAGPLMRPGAMTLLAGEGQELPAVGGRLEWSVQVGKHPVSASAFADGDLTVEVRTGDGSDLERSPWAVVVDLDRRAGTIERLVAGSETRVVAAGQMDHTDTGQYRLRLPVQRDAIEGGRRLGVTVVPAPSTTGQQSVIGRIAMANRLGREALRRERTSAPEVARTWERCARAWLEVDDADRAALSLAGVTDPADRAEESRQLASALRVRWADPDTMSRRARPPAFVWEWFDPIGTT